MVTKPLVAVLGVLCVLLSLKYGAADAVNDTVCDKDELPEKCPGWKAVGHCTDKVRKFMERKCRKTCGLPCLPETTRNPNTKAPAPQAFCRDRDSKCQERKKNGQCLTSKNFMEVFCGVTCNTCKKPTDAECVDKEKNCKELMDDGKCRTTSPYLEHYVKTNCVATCNFCKPPSAGSGSGS
ncbi:uncharacterized protein [Montipora capricornis]|uniref:uncharacterized protein n=1 Tax=Montipora capricornis TaxID=246305 RepID=UPI0035F14A16